MAMSVFQEKLPKIAASSSPEAPETSRTLQKNCAHCKIPFTPAPFSSSEYCCPGCEAAWHMIQGLGLKKFYAMTVETPIRPAARVGTDYSIYDSAEFQEGFTRRTEANPTRDDLRVASLLIEGITCYACVWLIRNGLNRQFSAASQQGQEAPEIQINQATGETQITWDSARLNLSDIIKFIESLGYHVMPHRGQPSVTNQDALVRVGVGLFVMMNVMSFALAEYFAGTDGLDATLSSFLRWLSLALTTLSLTWTGREFFVNTWRAIKTRSPNIDAPILVGLIGAYVLSAAHTISGHGVIYFDSICAIVALVMTGRFIQQTVLTRNRARMAALVNPRDGWVLTKKQENVTGDLNEQTTRPWTLTRASAVKKGDLVRVYPGELFPLRVTCVSSCAEVSYEQLRGEVDWKTVPQGGDIPAGALNGSVPVDVIASQNGAESYTESLARSIDRAINDKGIYHKWSDRAAWILFVVVFAAAAGTILIVGQNHMDEAISRAVAILLVACPCTFAIGTPLTFGTAMTQALRDGILFKSQRALEKLAGIENLVFDKTGTLTDGQLSIRSWEWAPDVSPSAKQTLMNRVSVVDRFSSHHVANAVAAYARTAGAIQSEQPNSISESSGMGLAAMFDQDEILIGRADFLRSFGVTVTPTGLSDQATTHIALNKRHIASLALDDKTRAESPRLASELRHLGCHLKILSGDSTSRTETLASELNIDKSQARGEATPGSKLLFIRGLSRREPVAMIGNGLNDSGAMAHADVSIAVAGSSSSAMNTADICLLKPDMLLVTRTVLYAREARRRLRLVFGFSLFYNFLGLGLAAAGHVTPVVAAILMPISSLTITRVATSWSLRAAADTALGPNTTTELRRGES